MGSESCRRSTFSGLFQGSTPEQSRFATPRYFEKYTLVCQPNYMVGAPCICMAEPEAFQDELIGHIKYMGTPPGPSREVRLRRAPPAAQTPAGGARGGMLSMEAGRARCRPRGPRTQPAPAMWRSTCISYGVRIRPMSSSWNASGSAIQIHGASTM